MGTIDEGLKVNEAFASRFGYQAIQRAPARKLAIVTCMDARLVLDEMLGLKVGDANVIRNAGGIVTDDVLRSLVISHYLGGTQEFMVIGHTDCGMLTFNDEELIGRLQRQTGTAVISPSHFHSFKDVRTSVLEQLQKIRSHPWIPRQLSVRGFIYEVYNGKLTEVAD